jgi:hypothetical protein
MFERYTEKARRVIFFARYEASQFGSPYIESEHLLLGIVREDKTLTNRFLRSQVACREIRCWHPRAWLGIICRGFLGQCVRVARPVCRLVRGLGWIHVGCIGEVKHRADVGLSRISFGQRL